jgi:hypothetical protein
MTMTMMMMLVVAAAVMVMWVERPRNGIIGGFMLIRATHGLRILALRTWSVSGNFCFSDKSPHFGRVPCTRRSLKLLNSSRRRRKNQRQTWDSNIYPEQQSFFA